MYDLLNDNAGIERHKQMLKEADEIRRNRMVAKKSNLVTQLRSVILKTLSIIIR